MIDWPEREKNQPPEVTGRPDEPWWTRDAITWLDKYLQPNMRVLEWGAGSSTAWLARRVEYLQTIEHNPQWAAFVKARVQPSGWFCIETAMLGPKYYDRFSGNGFKQDYYNFFDVVIVDGRMRVLCCEHGAGLLKPGGILVLDNAERPKYSEAHRFLKCWPVIRTYNGLWRTDIWTKPDA